MARADVYTTQAVGDVALAPLSVSTSNAAAIARAGRGADIVFDVLPLRWSLEPLMTHSGRYFIISEVAFRVVEVA